VTHAYAVAGGVPVSRVLTASPGSPTTTPDSRLTRALDCPWPAYWRVTDGFANCASSIGALIVTSVNFCVVTLVQVAYRT
jgi:hypothetical protein